MSGGQSATATALKAFIVFCVNSGRLLHRNPFSLFNTLGKQEEETGHSRLVPSLRLITHSQSRGEKRCRSVTRALRSSYRQLSVVTGGVRRSARVFDRIGGGGSSVAAEGNVNGVRVRGKSVVIVDCARTAVPRSLHQCQEQQSTCDQLQLRTRDAEHDNFPHPAPVMPACCRVCHTSGGTVPFPLHIP